MIDKIISLTKKFISIKSTPENKEALDKILEVALLELKGFTIERFENNGVKSVLIYNLQKRPQKFKILLNGHLDILPGKEHQYLPKVTNNRIYGVGSMDMKASVACLIMVFKEIANKVNYPLALQLVTDEEIGGFNGTKYQIEKGIGADFVIVGEATNLNIENQAKGILWTKISSKGKTAHGAYPWKGKNAIWEMNKLLNLLEKNFPVPNQEKWITTVNLSRIETSNQTFNKIPDDCTIWLDIRYIPKDSNTIVNSIKRLLPQGFKLDVILKEPALSTDENNQFLKLLQTNIENTTKKDVSILAANGSSDVRHFSRVNCDGVEFGPIGKGMGSDNEWVDIQNLGLYVKILREFLMTLDRL